MENKLTEQEENELRILRELQNDTTRWFSIEEHSRWCELVEKKYNLSQE